MYVIIFCMSRHAVFLLPVIAFFVCITLTAQSQAQTTSSPPQAIQTSNKTKDVSVAMQTSNKTKDVSVAIQTSNKTKDVSVAIPVDVIYIHDE